jgi:ubiquinol-cytochrome c reductase cytochrome c1 subunit
VNNLVFPDVAMPHVLLELQGDQVLSGDGLSPLRLAHAGKLNKQQYDQAIQDLVNFLVYVGEPAQEARKNLGVWVLLFLGVFLLFAFLLKKEYWKDIR